MMHLWEDEQRLKSLKWVPGGRIPIGHIGMNGGTWITGLSRNFRLVMRISGPDGRIHTWRMRRGKSIKMNRLPRGSKRTTGVWNGQNVADMVAK
jgi:hypothetical protein